MSGKAPKHIATRKRYVAQRLRVYASRISKIPLQRRPPPIKIERPEHDEIRGQLLRIAEDINTVATRLEGQ